MNKEIKSNELDFQRDYRYTLLGSKIEIGNVVTCFAPQFKKLINGVICPISNEELMQEIESTDEKLSPRFEINRIDISPDLGSKFEIIGIKN